MYKIKTSRLLALSVTTAISLTTSTAIAETDKHTGFASEIIDATELGDLAKVQNLISNGANPNERGEFGTTPLMRAVHNNNLALVNVLLSSGANTNTSDVGGATAVSIAAREGRNDILAALIKQGANLNTADNEGFTPLMRATLAGNTPAVQELIQGGAKVNIANHFGETALSQASHDSKTDIAQLLQQNGADDALKTKPVKLAQSLHEAAAPAQEYVDGDQADIVIDFSAGKLSSSTRAENYHPVVRQVASTNQKEYFTGAFYVPSKDTAQPQNTAQEETVSIPAKAENSNDELMPPQAALTENKWIQSLRQVARVDAGQPYQLSSNEMIAPSETAIIDLGNFKTQEFANKKIDKLKKTYPEIFAELSLKAVVKNSPAGVYYQVTGGLTNPTEADKICKRLVASGTNCHALSSTLQSQDEFNNYGSDANIAKAAPQNNEAAAAAPSPKVQAQQLTEPGALEANSMVITKYNALDTAAGDPSDSIINSIAAKRNAQQNQASTTVTTTVTPATAAPSAAAQLLKIITPTTAADTTPPVTKVTTTVIPPAAQPALKSITPTPVATTVTTTVSPAPAAHTSAAVESVTTTTTTVAPAAADIKVENAPEDNQASEEPAKPVKKKRPPVHHHHYIPPAGKGEPPKDLSNGQALDSQFEVARPVKSADVSAPPPVPFSQQIWIKVSNFSNAEAAHDFWSSFRGQNSNFAGYRMRTNTNVARPDLTSLEIGPFASEEDSKNACAAIAQNGVNCTNSDTLPARTVNNLPIASAYVDDHNMPLVDDYQLGGGNWNIQLGTYDSYPAAQEAWENFEKQSKHLKKIKSDIVPVNDKFRLRAGSFNSSSQADSLCDELRAKAISCIIIKN